MSEGRWRITVTPPNWGQDHLSSDAIVAYVDDELSHGPHERAARHIARCAECEAQVIAQTQTRSALRTAGGPVLPSTLLRTLRSIPESAALPPAPPGLAVTSDGQFVSVLRPIPDSAQMATDADPAQGTGTAHSVHRKSAVQRRIRVGTGVAVSGLALGALAYGLPSASSGPAAPPESGAFGGTVLSGSATSVIDTEGAGVLDAQMRLERAVPLGPEKTSETDGDYLRNRLDVLPRTFHGLP
ncbi:MAG TPA: zf-HC2 domain-containing protein [Pseudonocardia sp.]